MNILVTGANGFVGKNLIAELKNKGYNDIFEFTRESDPSLLEKYTKECDFVFHLAGVNRPKDENEFMEGNFGFTSQLLELLKKHGIKLLFLLLLLFKQKRIILMEEVKRLERIYYLIIVKKLMQKFMYIDYQTYLVSGVNLTIILW